MEERSIYSILDYYDTEHPEDGKKNSSELFCQNETDEVIRARHDNIRKLKINKERFLCGYCRRPIQICGNYLKDDKTWRATGKQSYHFRHRYPQEEGKEPCPYSKEGEKYLTKDTINALKYKGLPPSPEHERAKEALYQCATKFMRNVEKEKYIRHKDLETHAYRRADIYAEYNGICIVFEIQRTPISPNIVIGRDDFYQENDIFILWIIYEANNPTCTKRDIFVDNCGNLFEFDKEAQHMSEKTGELYLTCYYNAYEFDEETQEYIKKQKLHNELIPFTSLIWDEKTMKIFYKTDDEIKDECIKQHEEQIKNEIQDYLPDINNKLLPHPIQIGGYYDDYIASDKNKQRIFKSALIYFIREKCDTSNIDTDNLRNLLKRCINKGYITIWDIFDKKNGLQNVLSRKSIPNNVLRCILSYMFIQEYDSMIENVDDTIKRNFEALKTYIQKCKMIEAERREIYLSFLLIYKQQANIELYEQLDEKWDFINILWSLYIPKIVEKCNITIDYNKLAQTIKLHYSRYAHIITRCIINQRQNGYIANTSDAQKALRILTETSQRYQMPELDDLVSTIFPDMYVNNYM